MSRQNPLLAVAVTLALAASAHPARAQGWLNKVKEKAAGVVGQAGDAANKAATDVASKKADRAVRCAMRDQACVDSAKAAGKAVTIDSTAVARPAASAPNAAAPNAAAAAGAAAPAPKPGEGAWANYDFKPGDTPLFTDDFSQEVVGNFPRRLAMKSGASEVVEWQGKRWLSSGVRSEFYIPLGQVPPQRYTIEFDMAGAGAVEMTGDPKRSVYHHDATDEVLEFGDWYGGLKRENDATSATGFHTSEAPVHVAVQVDGDYVKAYVNEKRVANVPNAKLVRSNKLYVRLEGANDKTPMMIANLRVMAGGRALYDALAASGRVATQGIYFATGSDDVRPESSPTLKEIGAMLADHPDLQLTIVGHTDNVGDAAANQALSQRRAEAVRQALVSGYGVDAARLTAKGMGAAAPVATNTTAEGRAANRRVELVRAGA